MPFENQPDDRSRVRAQINYFLGENDAREWASMQKENSGLDFEVLAPSDVGTLKPSPPAGSQEIIGKHGIQERKHYIATYVEGGKVDLIEEGTLRKVVMLISEAWQIFDFTTPSRYPDKTEV